MANSKNIVVTTYGHGKNIDKISVSLFDCPDGVDESNANAYCGMINNLDLKENSWVYAEKIPENVQCDMDIFYPYSFSNIIPCLDRASIMKILAKTDAQELAKALKGESDMVKEAIFGVMSEKAAQMLKDDMEYMGPIPNSSAKEARGKISAIILDIEKKGEIIINVKGEPLVK
jgi:hypothetical protein